MGRASQPLGRPASVPLLAGRAESEGRARAITATTVTAAAFCAVLLGALAAYSPVAALGVVVIVGYGALVLRNLPTALALWIPLIFFEGLSGLSYIPEATGLLLALGWVIALARSRTSSLGGRVAPIVLAPLAALVLWITASLLWAQAPEESIGALVRVYSVVFLFVMLVNRVTSRRALMWLIGAFVVGAALSVVYGLLTGLSEAPGAVGDDATVAQGRLQGGVGDPNFLAASLISAAALVGAIGVARRVRVQFRALLVLAGAVMPIGVLSTGSRGGVLAAIAAVVLTLLILRGYRRRALALVAISLVVVAGYASFSPIAPLDRFTQADSSGGSGRLDLWTVGWRMAADYPWLGVGIANFQPRAHEYAREPGALTRVNYISETVQEVHNLYLQVATETGVPGVLLLLAFVSGCVRCTWRAAERFRASGEHRMATFARLLLIAQVSMLAADTFLSALVDKRLWIILALGPILANIAAREASPATSTAAV